jgi:ABC-2 type transport system ATP-binding protein
MTDVAVRTAGLRRSFAGQEAVAGVDLEVRTGEVFGFLGPNGAGKTTTVRMLCTLLRPTSGTATVVGLDVVKDATAVRRRIGVALQEIGLDPLQTGRELLELQAALYRVPRPRDRAAELLALVGLEEAADRRVKGYSGGMKRRLDLASALVHAPDVLFLDEPTTGLDVTSRITVWDEVRRINEGGATVFLTTQYLEEADQLCDRLSIIDRGTIVAEGTPDGLKSSMGADVVTVGLGRHGSKADLRAAVGALPGVDHVVDNEAGVAVYVTNGAAAVPAVVRALDEAGIDVGTVSISRPTLDDVFLQATGRSLDGAAETTEESA